LTFLLTSHTELHITKAMSRWPCTPDAEDRLQAALTAWRTISLYKGAKAYAKAHKVNPVTFRQQLQGKLVFLSYPY
jgi:hypothetical protein